MKLIFLDVDGVLNHEIWYGSTEYAALDKGSEDPLVWEKTQFSPRSIELLNRLTDETGAKIVISSSWRKGRTLEELIELFRSVGVTGEVIGSTPCLYFEKHPSGYDYSVPRGCEIKAWLEINKGRLGDKMSRVRYVIFDDDTDMLWWQRDKFLWVDPHSGLTPTLIHRAKRILMY
jgi:hypothetical protein